MLHVHREDTYIIFNTACTQPRDPKISQPHRLALRKLNTDTRTMTAPSSRVALIVGAGSNVGASLVQGFHGAGYRVATVSRSGASLIPNDNSGSSGDNYHAIQADASDPSAVSGILANLASAKPNWPFPSVVVWNAATMTPPPETDAENPLAVPVAALDRDLGLMIKSPYVAAQTAVEVWRDKSVDKKQRKGTFIMTGNMLAHRILPVPGMVTLGIGKSGGNFWVGLADAVFKEKGMR